jgi:uncharacterized membrane protein (DUF485 family)
MARGGKRPAPAARHRGATGGPAERERAIRELSRARTRIALLLTAAVVGVYFGFIASVAWARGFLGVQMTPGLSVGIALGASVIVVSWLLTWAYVRWANGSYDPALRALRESS